LSDVDVAGRMGLWEEEPNFEAKESATAEYNQLNLFTFVVGNESSPLKIFQESRF
jgi:hypothetical protein